VHTGVQQTRAGFGLAQLAALGAGQSVATLHCGVDGHGVCDSLQVPATQIALGQELVPLAHSTQGVAGCTQLLSLTHWGVGHAG
jgi:hypothetical protein